MKKYLTLIILLTSLQTQAADRALIIGITQYQQSKYQLPGIDNDVEMAIQIAEILKFKPEQIKTLTASQATAHTIKNTISTWLVNGVSTQDRVFLYYSGHGGQFLDKNGDEQDGVDEYITAYDLGNEITQGGYILDDEMSQLLAQIPSHYKIIVLDSCHSGTATRGIQPSSQKLGGHRLYPKLHYFGKRPIHTPYSPNQHTSFIQGASNTLTFAAATDNESARAGENGSLFTIGLYQALMQSTQQAKKITPKELIKKSQAFIAQFLTDKDDVDAIHHPLIFGDKSLINKPLKLINSRNGQGVNWQNLARLAKMGKPLVAKANKNSYKINDRIVFSLEIPFDGYINIINVDAKDQATVLFPNQYNQNNYITVGRRQIPSYKHIGFEITAGKPYGESLTVFVLTKKPLNFYKTALNIRDDTGKFVEFFAQVSPSAMRSMKIQARQNNKTKMYSTAIKTTVE